MMVTLDPLVTLRALPAHIPGLVRDAWRALAFSHLDRVLQASPAIEVDDRSRIVLLSDAHRGDNSRADAFRHNARLFVETLRHYADAGFTYIEVGDGDELWQNHDLRAVQAAHPEAFDLLHRLDADRRLHLLLGNHDIQGRRFRHRMVKDGMPVGEGLVLRSGASDRRMLVLHGHQADCTADQLQVLSRNVVRRVWRRVLVAGIREVHPQATRAGELPSEGRTHPWRLVMKWLRAEFVQRLVEWVDRTGLPLICGHTHLPHMPASGEVPYFNTGNCVSPGRLTGLEIAGGQICQVRWTFAGDAVERQVLGAPLPLVQFA